jgi:diguanylate cyclase (GGDEF)-like protein/PAS domain S-box-containing protein
LTKLRIKSRIFAGFGGLILICCVMVAAGVGELSAINDQVGVLSRTFNRANASQQLLRAAEVMRRAAVHYKSSGDDSEIRAFADAATAAANLIDASIATTGTPQRRKIYEQGAKQLAAVRESFQRLVDLETQIKATRAGLFGYGEQMASASEYLSDRAHQVGDIFLVGRAADVAVAIEKVRVTNWRFLATIDPKGPSRFHATVEAADDALLSFSLAPGAEKVADALAPLRENLRNFAESFSDVSAMMLQADVLFEKDIVAALTKFADGQELAHQSLMGDLDEVEVATLSTTETGATTQGLLGIAGIVFGLLLASMIGRGIVVPVAAMTFAMRRLADRDMSVEIPGVGRGDEIGAMAKAVQVFKEGMQQEAAMQLQQQATRRFLDTVLEHVPAPILVKNARDFRYVHANLAAETFVGVNRDEMRGKTVADISAPETAELIMARDIEALTKRGSVVSHDELLETLSNGQRLATVTRVAIAGADGEPQYLLTMIEDVTERRQAERRIAYLAHNDTLTDLPNRNSFAQCLEESLQRAGREPCGIALLGLDLDHFKEVNDTLGHAAGDALLRAVAERFRHCLRKGDVLARIGGDEFAAIQHNVSGKADAEKLAARLINVAQAPFEIAGRSVQVGLSVGVALAQSGVEADDLLKQADMALYEAKEAGRGRCRFFLPEMDIRLHERRALEKDLIGALEAGQLTLNYQPQVDLVTRTIIGAEALMRWTHLQRGNVPPNLFIPIAEEIGLIGPIGAWLLQAACAEAISWVGEMHVSVNVSPVQLGLPGFVDSVRQALQESGLHPSRLELEVTEGILLRDSDETASVFGTLRAMGIKLVLDDYGTGYASLSYLKQFRFDKIKIDQSFVRGLCTDPAASAIVRSTIELSRSLGMRTNAEGVESDEEASLLRSFGCEEAQGYHFWRPMAAQAMRALVVEVVPSS